MVDLKCSDSFCYATTTLSHTRTRTHSSPTQTIAACWVEFPVLPGQSPLLQGADAGGSHCLGCYVFATRLQMKQCANVPRHYFSKLFQPFSFLIFYTSVRISSYISKTSFFLGGGLHYGSIWSELASEIILTVST